MDRDGVRNSSRDVRRQRYRRGLAAEVIAAVFLLAKGYRILARRVKTPYGEIDLVVRTRTRVSFVEVKSRPTFEDAEAAIGLRQSERVHRAAEAWISRRSGLTTLERTFDIVFIVPWSWPRHYVNAL